MYDIAITCGCSCDIIAAHGWHIKTTVDPKKHEKFAAEGVIRLFSFLLIFLSTLFPLMGAAALWGCPG
jgi:hypothetical protein